MMLKFNGLEGDQPVRFVALRFMIAVMCYLAFSFAVSDMAKAATAQNDMGESYAIPTFRELTQTLFMMDGLDIGEPVLAQEYAKLMYCGLWKENNKNDFDWNKIRQMITNRVMSKKDYYRIQYEVGGTIFLGTYNFETQDFPFTKASALTRVGSMMLLGLPVGRRGPQPGDPMPLCTDTDLSPYLPPSYILIMNQPLTFDRLKIPMDEARILLDKMTAAHNMDRRLYVRFRFRVQSVDKVVFVDQKKKQIDLRTTKGQLHGELTQADVFLDSDMTKWLASVPLKQ